MKKGFLILGIFLITCFLNGQTIYDSLLCYFPFNSNADDESGNGNHGTVYGAKLTNDRFGNPNSAYSFDGVDDYIIKDAEEINRYFTISGWMYISDSTKENVLYSERSGWGSFNDGRRSRIIIVRVPSEDTGGNANKFLFEIRTEAGNWNDYDRYRIYTVNTFSQYGWYFICSVRDNLQLRLYINGIEQIVTIDDPGGTSSNEYDLRDTYYNESYFSAHGASNGMVYDSGILDDIRIYNRVLSHSEIYSLYTQNTSIVSDSLALVALYNSTNGAGWTNSWNLSNPVSSWYGVTVLNNRVVELELDENNLSGTIPHEIGLLTNLTDLNLGWNLIVGTVPAEIGNLINLIYLSLHENNLQGSFPFAITNLTALRTLNLINNSFSGAIPQEIINCSNLRSLDISGNQFDVLPDLTSMISLSSLVIHNNKFTFKDIELNINTTAIVFSYSPQDSVGIEIDTVVSTGSSFTLSTSAGGNNTLYQWQKGGVNISEAASDSTFTVDSVNYYDEGIYNCKITNTVADKLVLYSRPVNVDVIRANTEILSYYPFNGNANDESGNENHGTVYGATLTEDRFGNPNSAYSFDGIDDYIIKYVEDINRYFTITGWVYVNDITQANVLYTERCNYSENLGQGDRNRIIVQRLASDDFHGENKFKFEIRTKTDEWSEYDRYMILTDKEYDRNDWYFICAVRDDHQLKLYVNGTEQDVTVDDPGDNSANEYDLQDSYNNEAYFASQFNSFDQLFFNGKLDDIRIYDRVLSSDEILSLYQENDWHIVVAHYPFDGNTDDQSGNEHHAINHQAVITEDRFGNPNSAYFFDGNLSWIEIPYDSEIYPDEQTISLWINYASFEEIQMILRSGDAQDTPSGDGWHGYELSNYGEKFRWNDYTGSDYNAFLSYPVENLNTDTWYHIVVTRSGNSAKLYINGQLISTEDELIPYAKPNYSRLLIGRNSEEVPVGEQFFHGKIDDIYIYNCILSYSEIQGLYHAGNWPVTYELSHTINFPLENFKTTDYRLIGIPGNNNIPINNVIQGTYKETWRAYWDNGMFENYKEEFDSSVRFNFIPGRGFWIIHKGDLSIDRSVPAMVINEDYEGEILLDHQGWNIISNPFNVPVLWDNVRARNSITEPIFDFGGTDSWSESGIFEPYTGYYFDNTRNDNSLIIPFGNDIYKLSVDRSNGLNTEKDINWLIRIELRSGEIYDGSASLGVSPKATNSRDNLDYRKPRAPGNLASVFYYRPEWDEGYGIFARDIRQPVKEIEKWDFQVSVPEEEGNKSSRARSSLTFNGIEDVPGKFEVYLIDKNALKSIDLREISRYEFSPVANISKFEILIGRKQAIDKEIKNLLPEKFSLGNNYPNPFNPETTIPIQLPEKLNISLRVYNILGQCVRTIVNNRVMDAGKYNITFDGKDQSGRILPTGIYIYRIETDKFKNHAKKMIMIK